MLTFPLRLPFKLLSKLEPIFWTELLIIVSPESKDDNTDSKIVDEISVADAHPGGNRPFERSNYIE